MSAGKNTSPGVYLSSKNKQTFVIHGRRGNLVVDRRELDHIATDIEMMYHYDGMFGNVDEYFKDKETARQSVRH